MRTFVEEINFESTLTKQRLMAEARGRRLGAQMENVAKNHYPSVAPMFVMKISSRDNIGNVDSDTMSLLATEGRNGIQSSLDSLSLSGNKR